MDRYKIIRFYRNGRRTTVNRNLSLEEAQRWCSRDDTRKVNRKGEVVWFDGFTKQ